MQTKPSTYRPRQPRQLTFDEILWQYADPLTVHERTPLVSLENLVSGNYFCYLFQSYWASTNAEASNGAIYSVLVGDHAEWTLGEFDGKIPGAFQIPKGIIPAPDLFGALRGIVRSLPGVKLEITESRGYAGRTMVDNSSYFRNIAWGCVVEVRR